MFSAGLQIEIFGTGGSILQNMKNLLQCLPGLERLELVDLQLDGNDGQNHVTCDSIMTRSLYHLDTCCRRARAGRGGRRVQPLPEESQDSEHHQRAILHDVGDIASIHVTRDTCVNRYVSSFVNLRCLIISPHNLGDDLVENIGNQDH